MILSETLRVAVAALVTNKLRSMLTMLGIIIGIAAVITMVALGEGARRAIGDQLAGLGTNVISIRPGQAVQGGVASGNARLTMRDAEALAGRASEGSFALAPEMSGRYQVDDGVNNAEISVTGTWPNLFAIRSARPTGGRLFTYVEDEMHRRVAVLGSAVGSTLGLASSDVLLGETIYIRGVAFQVVGVLEAKGDGFGSTDENIYVPLGTAQHRLMGTDRLQTISIQAASATDLETLMQDVDRVIRRAHRLTPGETSDFTVQNQASLVAIVEDTARLLSFLLAGIAGISLLVGGIGIMNIMLVSVTERTREIGLRKALGAKPRDLLMQFLIESIVLCVLGGLFGMLLGFAASTAIGRLGGISTVISPESVLLAFGFAAGVGLFFGMWPARRAAALPPIEALRFE